MKQQIIIVIPSSIQSLTKRLSRLVTRGSKIVALVVSEWVEIPRIREIKLHALTAGTLTGLNPNPKKERSYKSSTQPFLHVKLSGHLPGDS